MDMSGCVCGRICAVEQFYVDRLCAIVCSFESQTIEQVANAALGIYRLIAVVITTTAIM